MKKKLMLFCILSAVIIIIDFNASRHFRNFLRSVINRKKHVVLVVGVISAPSLVDRRQAIRNTWFKFCSQRQDIVCKFFMDSLSDMDVGMDQTMIKENNLYNDIVYMDVPRGINFGRRILWFLDWSNRNYVFDFVLRVDDDVFVCLQRLLYELPFRQESRLYWGHIHCIKDRVRVDEEFLLLSSDLVQEFLRAKDTLLCNPYGDISVALWVKNVPDVTYFHDKRVYHAAKFAHKELVKDTLLCHKYLALNNAYRTETLQYWINVQHETPTNFDVVRVEPFDKVCNMSKDLKWLAFAKGHRFEPVRCVRKPTWNLLGHIYLGLKGEEAKMKKLKALRMKIKNRKKTTNDG